MLEGLVCLTEGDYRVCVDPNKGAHIVEYSVRGRNALHTQGPAIGSTFWPSPQEAWGWPPPKALDRGKYRVNSESANSIELTSEVCEQTGLQVRKQVSLFKNRMEVTYTMINASQASVSFAPWEISRIGGGVTFYKSVERPLPISTGPSQQAEGYVWHEYNVSNQTQNEKIFGNGSSGWVANAYKGLLLIKRFATVKPEKIAPGEAEVEIYGHGDPASPYIEMEQQGEFQQLKPGDHLDWSVTWFLRPLPQQSSSERKALYHAVEQVLEADVSLAK